MREHEDAEEEVDSVEEQIETGEGEEVAPLPEPFS